jgi:hypothetical protein
MPVGTPFPFGLQTNGKEEVCQMQIQSPNRVIVGELYRALVLLGAESDLLGTVGSWGDSLPEEDVLANLKGWNEATVRELKERIEHYEISCPRLVCSRDEGRKNVQVA